MIDTKLIKTENRSWRHIVRPILCTTIFFWKYSLSRLLAFIYFI